MNKTTYEGLIRDDGYINATELFKASGKDLSNWKRTKKTQDYITMLCKYLKYNENEIIQVHKGNSIKYQQGTWVHPLLATNIGQYISVEFSFKISTWIEEWKIHKEENILKYNKEFSKIKADENNQKEKNLKLQLHKDLGGKIEVETKFGFIDLLTDIEIIEIKVGYNWKYGVGQLLAYGEFYPHHKKRLHLFDIEVNEDINLFCNKYEIIVSYEIIS
jgi:hypothetical protein